MRILGYEISKCGEQTIGVYVKPDGTPSRVSDLTPDEARYALAEIVYKLRLGQVAYIPVTDKFGRIRFRSQ
jgi:hypothetical protein